MKQGKTLTELAAELERQTKVKEDYVADTRTLSIKTEGIREGGDLYAEHGPSRSALSMVDGGTFGVNDIAHGQIALRLGIPKKYYERLRTEVPDLLDTNVNTLFREKPEKRMVRTLDGTARAFLSDRYRRLDNWDIANAVLPILGDLPGDPKPVSCQLTDTRMYLKFVFMEVTTEVDVGDIVRAGLVVSNSEVGFGAVKVEPMIERLVCTNGMIVPDRGMSKYHVGRQVQESEEAAYRLYRDETVKADDRAFMMKVEDIVKAAADESLFEAIVDDLKGLTDTEVDGDPVASVERLAKKENLTEGERGGVLQHLVKGGDLSRWGMVNAVTRTSQDVESYDRATELERMGGKMAAYSDSDWKALATA